MDYLTHIGSLASVIGLMAAIFFFFSKINKSLDQILDTRSFSLDRDQAIDLLELYLSAVQSEMQTDMKRFIEYEFPKHSERNDKNAIYNYVFKTTEELIGRHRARVSRFNLLGGQNFRDFLNANSPLDDGSILEAKKAVNKAFCAGIGDPNASHTMIASIVVAMQDAKRMAHAILLEAIEKRYN